MGFETWGNHEGKDVVLVTLENSNGTKAQFTNYGAIWVNMFFADKEGVLRDVCLGCDSLADYLENPTYFGAVVGRVANRIRDAKFSIGDQEFEVDLNSAGCQLHGGTKGFNRYVWDFEEVVPGEKVKFSMTSPSGDQGFPGQVDLSVVYTLTADDQLILEYHADVSEAPTILNICNHAYFNLSGEQSSVHDHMMTIAADSYTVLDDSLVPTGVIENVNETPLDFQTAQTIGSRIDEPHFMLTGGGGYDLNYCLTSASMEQAAKASCDKTGIALEVFTTEPGVQLYTGNFLEGVNGKAGATHNKRDGFCLETQHYPDSCNHANFPSTLYNPGEPFDSKTIFKFSRTS